MSPSSIGDYSATTKYPLFFKPDNKVSINQVFEIFRDRYQGTKYDLDVCGDNSYRPICIESSQSVQLLQTYKDVPANMACVDWAALSSGEFNTFIPFSNIESKFDEAFTYNPTDYDNIDEKCAFNAFKRLNAICAQNRPKLKTGVTNY